MTTSTVRGSLPEIVVNEENLYEGNLRLYFCAAFRHARNLNNPYHNFRHMFHVLWLCYQAGVYYQMEPRPMRNLLIAAMFHDFDHTGRFGADDVNIMLAIRGLEKYILPEDRPHLSEIAGLIRATEFPYTMESEALSLSAQIIRDADLGQAFSPAWIQQVVLGLAAEWERSPEEILKMQGPFLGNMKPLTDWGRKMFPQADIDAKVAEAEALIRILEGCNGGK